MISTLEVDVAAGLQERGQCVAADAASKSSGIDKKIMLERLMLSVVEASR